MILSFKKTDQKGNPTGFKDKILKGIKVHSIRADKGSRWRPGYNDLAMVSSRTTNDGYM